MKHSKCDEKTTEKYSLMLLANLIIEYRTFITQLPFKQHSALFNLVSCPQTFEEAL